MIFKQVNQVQKKNHPTQHAAVIRYDKDRDRAPVVVAQGSGEIAQKIIKQAQKHDIPLQQDDMLLGSLIQLDLGNQIPPQLYHVVAEVLLMVRRANAGELEEENTHTQPIAPLEWRREKVREYFE